MSTFNVEKLPSASFDFMKMNTYIQLCNSNKHVYLCFNVNHEPKMHIWQLNSMYFVYHY